MTGVFPDLFPLILFKLFFMVSFTIAVVLGYRELTRLRYRDEIFRPLISIVLIPLSLYAGLIIVRELNLYLELLFLVLSLAAILIVILRARRKK